MGRARAYELLGDGQSALTAINEAVVKHSWFAPALVDKARLSLAYLEWPDVLDCVTRLQQLDAQNVFAIAYRGVLPPEQIQVILAGYSCMLRATCLHRLEHMHTATNSRDCYHSLTSHVHVQRCTHLPLAATPLPLRNT